MPNPGEEAVIPCFQCPAFSSGRSLDEQNQMKWHEKEKTFSLATFPAHSPFSIQMSGLFRIDALQGNPGWVELFCSTKWPFRGGPCRRSAHEAQSSVSLGL